MIIRRGDIYYADLRPVVGSEQGGVRPVLIIQNDVGNRHSPTVIVAAIIGFSRMYLFVHYPSDVIIGVISGVLITLLVTPIVLGMLGLA